LSKYFTAEVMSDNYDFSPSGVYRSVTNLDLEDIKSYIKTFPQEDDTEVFGLHTNANITF